MLEGPPTVVANSECLLLALLYASAGVMLVIRSTLVRDDDELYQPVRDTLRRYWRVGYDSATVETEQMFGLKAEVSVHRLKAHKPQREALAAV